MPRITPLRVLFAALALGVVLIAVAATVGIALEGPAYRSAVSRWLTTTLGREVRIGGELRLQLGLRPALRVRELRIAQPAAFGDGDFARVGELRVELDLLPLWKGQWQAERLSASDVQVRLRQLADGRANWAFNLPDAPAEPADTSSDPEGSQDPARWLARLDIQHVQVQRLQLSYQGEGEQVLRVALDEFSARLPAGAGITATATGRVDEALDYQLSLSAGTLRELAMATQRQGAWPLTLRLDFAGSTLTLNGALGADDSRLRFGLGTTDLARFGRLLGMTLPDAGVAGMGGALRVVPAALQIDDLSAQLGRSSLRGAVALDLRRQRPRLQGALTVAQLDLKPFLGQSDDEDAPTDLPALYRSLSRAKLDLSALAQIDADLSLAVAEWISLPGELRDTSLKLQLQDGRLNMPFRATLEGVPVQGSASADASASSLSLAVQSERSAVGGLAQMITGLPGIEGTLGRLRLQLRSQGKDGESLMRSLSTRLELDDSQLSYGNLEQGKPVGFKVGRLRIQFDANQPLDGEFSGSLLGKPLSARLSGSNLRTAMTEPESSITLLAQSPGVSARLVSSMNAGKGSGMLTFSLGAERAGEVSAWLGLRKDARAPLALAGRIAGTADAWRLTDLVLQAGRTSALVNVERGRRDGRTHYQASVEVSGADAAELDGLLPPATTNTSATITDQKRHAATLDIPILPRQLVLDDADLRMRVHGVQRAAVAIGEIGADVRVREGFMQSSPFFAELAGHRFEGALMIDARDGEPHARLWLFGRQIDIGQIARDLKLAQRVDFTTESVSLYLDSRASRLSDFIANAQVLGELNAGRLQWRDAAGKPAGRIRVIQGSAVAAPGQPLSLGLQGDVDELPVTVSLRSASAKELMDAGRRVPFALDLSAAGSLLTLTGTLDRRIEARDIELQLRASGDRLDKLDRLTRVALPPWGPWSAEGRLRVSRQGYALEAMSVALGSSRLRGEGRLETTGAVPQLSVALSAPQIQLDDFRLAGWSATEAKRSEERDDARDPAALRRKATEASDTVQGLLSRETLSAYRTSLVVAVDRVLSGKDVLGGGKLEASTANGRLVIAPVSVAMPGGSAQLSLTYEPRERDVLADLKIAVDRFDYGVLGRRLKPDTDLAGRFSLNVDVRSRAPRLSQVLSHGSGTLDFALWPQDMKAGVFDLWAVNLFLALLPTIDPKNESRVNCAIGRFTVADGKLTQKKLVIDTSKVRVTGKTDIDLAKETLHMRLQPQAKTAQFLSLATPVEVTGSFTDYAIGPNAGDVIQTVIRLATSLVWVPIQRLLSDKVPEDGRDVCEMK